MKLPAILVLMDQISHLKINRTAQVSQNMYASRTKTEWSTVCHVKSFYAPTVFTKARVSKTSICITRFSNWKTYRRAWWETSLNNLTKLNFCKLGWRFSAKVILSIKSQVALILVISRNQLQSRVVKNICECSKLETTWLIICSYRCMT